MIIGITGNISCGKDTVAKMIKYYFMLKNNPSIIEGNLPTTIDVYLKHYNTTPLNESDFFDNFNQFEIKKFAYKLKQICAILVGCRAKDFESQEFKESYLSEEWKKPNQNFTLTHRQLLQKIGTECIRNNFHPNVWINALFADYNEKFDLDTNPNAAIGSYPNWIISDLRFINEAKAVKDRNGIIIKIIRPSLGANTDEHKSETELQSIIPDYEIVNDSNIEQLYGKVSNILNLITNKQ